MIKIPITEEDIIKAKRVTALFDSQKTHNKFVCSNNWIGVLGEMKFNEFLESKGLVFEWLDFVKTGTGDPDFRLNGKDYDLKTQTTTYLALPYVSFDNYIFSRVNKDSKDFLYLIGVISRKKIERLISAGKLFREQGLFPHWRVDIVHLDKIEDWLKKQANTLK